MHFSMTVHAPGLLTPGSPDPQPNFLRCSTTERGASTSSRTWLSRTSRRISRPLAWICASSSPCRASTRKRAPDQWISVDGLVDPLQKSGDPLASQCRYPQDVVPRRKPGRLLQQVGLVVDLQGRLARIPQLFQDLEHRGSLVVGPRTGAVDHMQQQFALLRFPRGWPERPRPGWREAC